MAQFTIIVAEGLDTLNPTSEETIISIKVNLDEHKIENIHSLVLSQLGCKSPDNGSCGSSNSSSSGGSGGSADDEQDLFYSSVGGEELNMSKTFQDLGLKNGGKIFLDSRARRAKLDTSVRLLKPVNRLMPTNVDPDDVSSTLQLLCTTRLVDNNGQPFRSVRVVVHCTHSCSYLMEDLHTLWSKAGLKFRCGRVVLSPEKTYLELGIEDNAEIVVTGGRG